TAVRRAVKLDATVGNRSSFVRLALGTNEPNVTPGTVANADPNYEQNSVIETPAPLGRVGHVSFRVSPLARVNPSTGSAGFGGGIALVYAFGDRDQTFAPFIGSALGTIHLTDMNGEYEHTILSAELGGVL